MSWFATGSVIRGDSPNELQRASNAENGITLSFSLQVAVTFTLAATTRPARGCPNGW